MKIRCPNCKQKLEFDDDLSGLTLECPCCNGKFEAKAPVAIADVAAKEQTPVQISQKLTKCKHCGKEIASNSFKCVHCGGQKELSSTVVVITLGLTFLCIFLYCCHHRTMDQRRYEAELRKQNRESMEQVWKENEKKREEEKKLLDQLREIQEGRRHRW